MSLSSTSEFARVCHDSPLKVCPPAPCLLLLATEAAVLTGRGDGCAGGLCILHGGRAGGG